jgi:pyridinium-3,5-biscarboxylic acid mononucleotide synthase
VDEVRLLELMARVARGEVAPAEAAHALRDLPFERVGDDAVVDHHRELRTGIPEVVLGEWKTATQIANVLGALAARGHGALATRVQPEKADEVVAQVPGAEYIAIARVVRVPPTIAREVRGKVVVVAAGTSDLAVADEAAVTVEFLGSEVDRIADVGVAGLHRLMARLPELRAADALVVVAGMEGALPSVVAGLVDRPMVAVPTSVGYGVGAGGLVALASMLSSCAPGVTVVNIDNGFGAGVAAARIARAVARAVPR